MNKKCAFQQCYEYLDDTFTYREITECITHLIDVFFCTKNEFIKECDDHIMRYQIKPDMGLVIKENCAKNTDILLDIRKMLTDYYNRKIIKFIVFSINAELVMNYEFWKRKLNDEFDPEEKSSELYTKLFKLGNRYDKYRDDTLDELFETMVQDVDKVMTMSYGKDELDFVIKQNHLEKYLIWAPGNELQILI